MEARFIFEPAFGHMVKKNRQQPLGYCLVTLANNHYLKKHYPGLSRTHLQGNGKF
jgi:hypothetical protein